MGRIVIGNSTWETMKGLDWATLHIVNAFAFEPECFYFHIKTSTKLHRGFTKPLIHKQKVKKIN